MSTPNDLPEDLLDLNPYHSVPTLVDRDLVLYDSRVIIEYLDERFPHPPLMPHRPGDPGPISGGAVSRSSGTGMPWRATSNWIPRARPRDTAARCSAKRSAPARTCSRPSRSSSAMNSPLVERQHRHPILWRLPSYGIELPAQALPITKYMNAIFARSTFRSCLTDAERSMRH